MQNFIQVLWQPNAALSSVPRIKLLHLVLIMLTVELFISLSMYNVYAAAAAKAAATNPMVTQSISTIVVWVALLTGALVNPVILLLAALIFLLVAHMFEQRPSFRDLYGMLILAAVPGILLRLARTVIGLATGLPAAAKLPVVKLSTYLPLAPDSAMGKMLLPYDFGDLWTLGLVMLGFSILSGLKRTPALVSSFLVWGLLLLAQGRLAGVSAA